MKNWSPWKHKLVLPLGTWVEPDLHLSTKKDNSHVALVPRLYQSDTCRKNEPVMMQDMNCIEAYYQEHMHTCIHAYIYSYIYSWTHIHTDMPVHLHICAYLLIYFYVHICTETCTHLYIYSHRHIDTFTNICVCPKDIYAYSHKYAHFHVYLCIHVHIYTCTHVSYAHTLV